MNQHLSLLVERFVPTNVIPVRNKDNLVVPDLVRAAVVTPIGNSDHSSLSAVISMAQAVLNLCVSRKVFLKHQVNWTTVCDAVQDLPWPNIWSADNF